VLRIEKSSLHDGDGLRTVVFLKGCSLHCSWCSTPESQSPVIEQGYGKIMTSEQVMQEVTKDEVFFFHSGGGLTVSGGEPLLQADFVAELLQESHHRSINTAMESSMCLHFDEVIKVLPHLDTLFADIKHMDANKHKDYCGKDNTMILDNIRRAAAWKSSLKLIARVPLIPGVNDDDENMRSLGEFCASLQHLDGVELLPYHRLGVGTYAKLGRRYLLPTVKTPSAEVMIERKMFLRQYIDNII
jgi:pyruvate formate lyase activating enzyme